MDPADAEAAPQGSIDDSESDAEEDGVQPGVEILLDEALADLVGLAERRQEMSRMMQAIPGFLGDADHNDKACQVLLALCQVRPAAWDEDGHLQESVIALLGRYITSADLSTNSSEAAWRMGCKALETAVRCAEMDESSRLAACKKGLHQHCNRFLEAALKRAGGPEFWDIEGAPPERFAAEQELVVSVLQFLRTIARSNICLVMVTYMMFGLVETSRTVPIEEVLIEDLSMTTAMLQLLAYPCRRVVAQACSLLMLLMGVPLPGQPHLLRRPVLSANIPIPVSDLPAPAIHHLLQSLHGCSDPEHLANVSELLAASMAGRPALQRQQLAAIQGGLPLLGRLLGSGDGALARGGCELLQQLLRGNPCKQALLPQAEPLLPQLLELALQDEREEEAGAAAAGAGAARQQSSADVPGTSSATTVADDPAADVPAAGSSAARAALAAQAPVGSGTAAAAPAGPAAPAALAAGRQLQALRALTAMMEGCAPLTSRVAELASAAEELPAAGAKRSGAGGQPAGPYCERLLALLQHEDDDLAGEAAAVLCMVQEGREEVRAQVQRSAKRIRLGPS